jgi:hypothetical protein
MALHLATLPSLPKWQVKVRTVWFNGKHVASVAIPTSHGMLTMNKESADEQEAVKLVLIAIEDLVNRIQFPYPEKLI